MSDDDPAFCVRQRQITMLKALAQAKWLGEIRWLPRWGGPRRASDRGTLRLASRSVRMGSEVRSPHHHPSFRFQLLTFAGSRPRC